MKTWLAPVLLIVVVMVGGVVIWINEGSPAQLQVIAQAPIAHPAYYPPTTPVGNPAAAQPIQPVPPPVINSNSSECEQAYTAMKGVSPLVSIGSGVSAYLAAESLVPNAQINAPTMNNCLWWQDTVSTTQKTYVLCRGLGGYDISIQSMTELTTLPGTYNSYLDTSPNGRVCYILQISDGTGKTYNTPDACLTKS